MSEPDTTGRRRPPTIDLRATEVEAEKRTSGAEADATEAAANGPADGKAGAGAVGVVGGALGGAVAVAAIFAVLWAAGVLPTRGDATLRSAQTPKAAANPQIKEILARLDKIEAALAAPRPDAGAVKELSARLDKIKAALAAPRPEAGAIKELSARLDKIEAARAAARPDTGLITRLATAQAETKSLGDSVAALNRRLDDVAVTARSALAHADAAAASANAATAAAQRSGAKSSDLDALDKRVAAIEGAQKTLADAIARRPVNADDRVARRSVAAAALRGAVERGAPYQAEFAAVQSLGVDENALAPLKPFAADGVPGATALGRELAALMAALTPVSRAPPAESSFLGRLQANAEKLVRVSPVSAPAGNDPAGVIARVNAAAARGDIAGALADIRQLPDSARSRVAPWVAKAEAREKAIAASRRIAAAALAALTKPAPQ